MLRALILLAVFSFGALLVAPFVVSSWLIDQRGMLIAGRVNSKREDVLVRHGNQISRSSEITVMYSKPDRSGVAFLPVTLSPGEYDSMPVGMAVKLHYLRPEDFPALPFAAFLRRAQLLPTVRLANMRALGEIRARFDGRIFRFGLAVSTLVVGSILWRAARLPGFLWAVSAAVLGELVCLTYYELPRPTPAPQADVARAAGRVKSLTRVDVLVEGREGGIRAEQPIQVVGVEFLPEGRTEPVLAMDLIDENSIPGLAEKSTVRVDYERGSPRTAYVVGAQRTFFSRNLWGIGMQVAWVFIGVAVLLAAWLLLGKGRARTP